MLSRKNRLQKKDIERLFKKGRVARQDSLMTRISPNRTDHSRFAIVISKKVLPLATKRNHARRRIYQIIQDHESFWGNKNMDVAIYLRRYQEENIGNQILKVLESLT